MRINRYIASCLNISRRRADEYIKTGRVSLNGVKVEGFVDVKDGDVVEVDGKRLEFEKSKVYYAFYKPPFVISSTADEQGRKTVCDYFDKDKKLICVGRLDYLSEGLLLVTNDGEFANLVMHPSFKIRKTYLVKTNQPLRAKLLKKMSEGVLLEDGFFKPLVLKKSANPNWIIIVIDTGRNRIIRRFFKAFDVKIDKLKRIAIGNIELKDLKEGSYRELSKEEIEQLKRIACKKAV